MTVLPRITIITPVLNRVDMIGAALASVRDQNYLNLEHIVVDGGSTDGTLDLLQQARGILWLSERDKGLYHAINKGIALASGDIIGHLNSDDIYLPNALAATAQGFTEHPAVDAVCGGASIIHLDATGQVSPIRIFDDHETKQLTWRDVTLGVPIINARFFRRDWYVRAGVYDCRYQLAADREFLLRSMLLGMKTEALTNLVYQYRLHSGSLTINPNVGSNRTLHNEYLDIAERYLAIGTQDPGFQSSIHRWYAREMGRKVIELVIARQPVAACRAGIAGVRHSGRWPLVFLGEVGRRLVQRN